MQVTSHILRKAFNRLNLFGFHNFPSMNILFLRGGKKKVVNKYPNFYEKSIQMVKKDTGSWFGKIINTCKKTVEIKDTVKQ
jgi:hypothetical protein